MGIIRYAAAVGLGYALARPEGRQQLLKLRDQGLRLLRRPEVARLQEQGQELVTQQVAAATDAVKEKLGRGDDHGDTSTRAADVFPEAIPDPVINTPGAAAPAASGSTTPPSRPATVPPPLAAPTLPSARETPNE